MHAYNHTRDTNTLKNFKATKDIAAGQEILVRYAGAEWFESKSIPYTEVDYARTMWRPDLHPLPCRENVRHITGADGRQIFAFMADTITSGTVLEVSLCVEVSVIVVDQFPFLWDFVLIDSTTQTVCVCEDSDVTSLLTRTSLVVSNPAGMCPFVIRRANPDHT